MINSGTVALPFYPMCRGDRGVFDFCTSTESSPGGPTAQTRPRSRSTGVVLWEVTFVSFSVRKVPLQYGNRLLHFTATEPPLGTNHTLNTCSPTSTLFDQPNTLRNPVPSARPGIPRSHDRETSVTHNSYAKVEDLTMRPRYVTSKASALPIAAMVSLISMTACGGGDTSATGQDQKSKPTKVVLRLDWKLSGQQTPFIVARDRGYYKEAGLDVQIDEGSGSTDSAKLVGTGRIDFGVVGAPVIAASRAQGLPIKSVAVLYQETPTCIMWVKGKTKISTPADFRSGIRLGINERSTHAVGIHAMFNAQDISEDDLNIVPVGPDFQPLLTGQVDAMGGLCNVDRPVIEHEGAKVGSMEVADWGVTLYGLTLAASEDTIESRPELVRSFVQATIKGWEEAERDPDAATRVLLESYPQGDFELDKAILLNILDLAKNPDGMGSQTERGWAATTQVLSDTGITKVHIPAPEMYSNVAFK